MTEAERRERKEQLRLYVLGTAVLTFFIAYAVGSWAVSSSIDDNRRTCEGGNLFREAQVYLGETLVNVNLERAQTSSSESERMTNRDAAAAYQKYLDMVVDSVQTQVAPDSVRRDCKAAYPKPVTWNWFE